VFVEKLTLFGFKSFNQRISLEFGSGISSIIGPNGCGKSNVVDAMRWVLGEQSTKQLRGTKMEDVIFNGTRDEKPLSMAEVELTLNNDRGRLSIDYGTVSVARRLYRSGVSEYFINKQPVRLKDVRDLFMDTGMGSHAYSVIERQMVDNILSDTTGHRRFLFEEAAGIMRYKTRKKEALTKLEATERDLVRVNDIITEVERQVLSLRRQVGKAQRYRELQDEIKGLDLAYSQGRRRAWKDEIALLKERHAGLDRGAEEGEAQVATLEARLEEIHLTVLEAERSLGEARELLAQAADEIGRRNSRILVLRERMEAARQRIQEAGAHQVRLSDRKERNAAATAEVETKQADLAGRELLEREERDRRESQLREAEERVRALRVQLGEAKQGFDGGREIRVRAEGALEAAVRRQDEMGARSRERSERQAAAGDERGARGIALDALRARLVAARAELAAEQENLRVHEVRAENLRSRLEVSRKGLAEKQAEEAAAKSRLVTLEDLKARYEGFVPGVRALMLDAARDPGVRGTVGDLVSIPHEWRKALEPVLSRIWQVLVVSDTATARRLVRRLGQESLGFADLVALDRVPDAPARGGGMTWAAEIVEAEGPYRSLLRYLLDGLALVPDLEDALRIVQTGAAPRAATASGEIVDAARISGGSGGPEGADLVEREEAIERCRRTLDNLVRGLSDLARHETELLEEKAALDARGAALAADLESRRANLAALEKDEAGASEAVRHAETTLRTLAEEQAALEDALAGIAGERASLAAEVETARARERALQETLEAADRECASGEAEREAVLASVHEARVAYATLDADLRDARATRERLAAERTDLESEWVRTLAEEAEAKQLVIDTEQEIVGLADAIQELNVVHEQRAGVVAERDAKKSEAVAREQIDSDALRDARRGAVKARQDAHELELRLHDLTGELKHLEERLRADYELDADALDRLEDTTQVQEAPERLAELRERLRRMGPVNLLAVEEYEEKSTRFEFMSTQRDDLLRAKDSLMKTIEEINKTASGMFLETFAKVQTNFQNTFQVLFQGGECSLTLTGDDPLEADIDVMARPRGKKPQSIAQLSSGERALTAIALLFAIYLVKPSPFCILDEVDAPLDDANIDRFVAMVKEFSQRTQFIVITHNKKTMEAADCLYGVTMQRPGVSTVVSVELEGERSGGRKKKGSGNGHEEAKDRAAEDPLSPESAVAQ
jgi:chromosome segregation protein